MNSHGEEQIYIVALRDEEVRGVCSMLEEAGVKTVTRRTLAECGPRLCHEAGALLVGEETLAPEQMRDLSALLAQQPEWSDLPVLVLLDRHTNKREALQNLEEENLQIRLLERPLSQAALFKRIQIALRARQRQYQTRNLMAELASIIQSSGDAIVGKNLDGIITWWNPAAERLFGWTAVEAVGKPMTIIFSPELKPEESDILERLRRGESIKDFETMRMTRDGRRLNVLISVTPVHDEAGQVVGASKIIHNITEQKRAEASLYKQNRRLGLLNKAAEQLLSARPEQLLAGVYEQMIRDTQADLFVEYRVNEASACLDLETCGGLDETLAARIQRLEFGETICGTAARLHTPIVANHIQSSEEPMNQLARSAGLRTFVANPLLVGDRLLGTLSFGSRRCDQFEPEELNLFATLATYVALGRDRLRLMRELRQHSQHLEHLVEERTATVREAMAEMQHLSYSMIHDMRAPLRAMHNFATLLMREAASRLTATGVDYLERIITASNRMDLLITEALNYNRAVRERPSLSPVDTTGLLQGMLKTYTEFQPPRAEVNVEPDLPWVQANPAVLTQCFSQLLHNAIKFVPSGQMPRVWIRSETFPGVSATHISRVRLWFEDNGLGLSPEARRQIFNLFEPLNQGPSMRGIGLAVVCKLVERMGGQVGIKSEPGHGSRFWVELPGAKTSQAAAHSAWEDPRHAARDT